MHIVKKIAASVGFFAVALGSVQAQELVVGSSATYRPFAYESPTKEIVGYDVDIIKAVAQMDSFTDEVLAALDVELEDKEAA